MSMVLLSATMMALPLQVKLKYSHDIVHLVSMIWLCELLLKYSNIHGYNYLLCTCAICISDLMRFSPETECPNDGFGKGESIQYN